MKRKIKYEDKKLKFVQVCVGRAGEHLVRKLGRAGEHLVRKLGRAGEHLVRKLPS